MHGSLVTSSLIRETTENESTNNGYKFGQEEETYNIVAAHGYFGLAIAINRHSSGEHQHNFISFGTDTIQFLF
jgi:hypothetical protein